mmetsp:Transcript_57219/g.161570  ORF Transcript_57219/g.161570 Transcript_57219/m.161570 type:complete len:238 (-) Transcript_57219:249-962(-)
MRPSLTSKRPRVSVSSRKSRSCASPAMPNSGRLLATEAAMSPSVAQPPSTGTPRSLWPPSRTKAIHRWIFSLSLPPPSPAAPLGGRDLPWRCCCCCCCCQGFSWCHCHAPLPPCCCQELLCCHELWRCQDAPPCCGCCLPGGLRLSSRSSSSRTSRAGFGAAAGPKDWCQLNALLLLPMISAWPPAAVAPNRCAYCSRASLRSRSAAASSPAWTTSSLAPTRVLTQPDAGPVPDTSS